MQQAGFNNDCAFCSPIACYNRDGSNSSNRKANGKKWLYGWC
jgi:hypothetical protein